MSDGSDDAAPVCLVTGAGRGIGAELASWFAATGARLVVCSRSPAELTALEVRLREEFGATVLARPCDVSEATQVEALVAETLARFGRIDVAVANAAVLGPVGVLTAVDMDAWRHAVDVNVVGTATVVRAVAPAMIRRGGGRIVALAGGGIGGPQPAQRVSAYVASKAAVVAFTEAASAELFPFGVTVNAVAPGRVPTAFMDDVVAAGRDVAGDSLFDTAVDGRPADLAPLCRLIAYLVSDEAAWLSGRLLSARWDRPEALEAARGAIESGSLYRLRRIDDDLYCEATV